ncbi:MAG TPA: sulfatase-like hydrolase/transferase [Kofleriaceae bacterium]|nr:sulfatase-like hydrolase/transferase [Kofleriaceae bacterium]
MTSKLRALTALALALTTTTACGKSKAKSGSAGGGSTAGTAAAGGGGATVPKPAQPPVKAASRGAEHPVYSFVDNRLSGHVLRGGGLVLVGGSAEFAKYTRFGNMRKIKTPAWQLRQSEGPVKVAQMTGGSARVDVPLTADQLAGTPVIRVRAYSPDARAFSVRVNDNKDVNGQLTAGWSTVELTPPAGQLKEGENQLLFFVRGTGLSIAWIQVGGTTTSDEQLLFYDASAKALRLPEGGGMAWYVMVPEHARLAADLTDGACTVNVKAVSEDGGGADGKLVGTDSAVDLSSLAGKAVRLELTAAGCPEARLTRASLVVPGDEAKPERGEPPKYVVMFIMDSLRADRVRPFWPGARPEVPTWEKLADSSALFMDHYVQGNESRVSHASLWSSLYPIKHGMIPADAKLDLKWKTVDEVAKAAGKYTAGASANGFIQPKRWGFGQAWDVFSNHIAEELGLKAQDVLDHGWKFVGDRKEPWFLYLGTVDTHVSWRAKEPWLSKYDPGYSGRFSDVFSGEDAANSDKLHLTQREMTHVKALYDSNVSYQDQVLGDLVEKLKTAGIWDQTMLIVTADHGDEQWEDGRVGHGGSSRDMLVHVPLLIHYPPMIKPGKYTEGTEIIDIVPTIADALGVQQDAEWQGQSLIPLTQGVGAGYPRLTLSSMYEDSHGARLDHWKVRISGGANLRVYDLQADPEEMKDIAGEPGSEIGGRAVLDPLWLLRTFNLEWKKSQWGNAANVTARFAQDMGE